MDLQGELKIAMLEIQRLRKQLTLLGPTSALDNLDIHNQANNQNQTGDESQENTQTEEEG